MTGASCGICCRLCRRIGGRAGLAVLFVAAALLPWPSRIARAQPGPARRGEPAQARDLGTCAAGETGRSQSRWLALREAFRLASRAPCAITLFVHPRDGAVAEELRLRLAARGYRLETVTAADGPVPIIGLLQAVRSQKAVLPTVAVMSGFADADAGTPLPQYTLALEEIITLLVARGASLERILLVGQPAGDEAERGYRDRLLAVARERGTLAANLDASLPPKAAGGVLAQAVLAAAAPHPSLLFLPLYPVFSLALLWLWRRSRF